MEGAGFVDRQPGVGVFLCPDDGKPVPGADGLVCLVSANRPLGTGGPAGGAGRTGPGTRRSADRPGPSVSAASGAGPPEAAAYCRPARHAGPGGGAWALFRAEPGGLRPLGPVQRLPVETLGAETGPVYRYDPLPPALYGGMVAGRSPGGVV